MGTQPYTRTTGNKEGWGAGRNDLPQRRAHQLFIQHQTVSPENTHLSNTIQTEQVVSRYVYVCAYMHGTTVHDKRGH